MRSLLPYFQPLVICVGISLSVQGCCNEAALPGAQQKLYSSQARDKTEALHTLSRCGTGAEPSVQRIAALMYDQNVGVASAAAYALRKIDSKQAREALQRAEEVRAQNRLRKGH